MEQQRRLRRLVWKWVVPAVGLLALGYAGYAYFHTPGDRGYRLTMTAGSAATTRHHLAEVLRSELAPCGLTLELQTTAGSEDALDEVNSGKLNCALVQGGLSVAGRPNVRLVAMLQIEPLHLLVKKELADKVAGRLTALDGKTVNVGDPDSGTHTLSVAVLAFAGLAPQKEGKGKGYIARELGTDRLMTATNADLPDAIFLVASLPSRVAAHLVAEHGYRLVPLPFGEAFALSSLAKEQGTTQASHAIDRSRTYAATIPAFTYGVEPATPGEALPTLGNRLLLVAHKGVNPRAIGKLVECVYGSNFAKTIRPPLDVKLMEMPPELPWHDGAEAYRQRNRPVVSGDVLNLAQKGTAILAATISGLVVLLGWLLQRRQARKGQVFRKLLNDVTRLDEEATRREEGGEVTVDELLALRGQLAQLRGDALDRFAEGELDDNELMSSFLAHVNSCRDHLTQLIAQQRHLSRPRPSAEYDPTASLDGVGAGPDEPQGTRPPGKKP
jgi:TRAP-type uncharacterized transport system substrate-binding protein